MAIVKGIRYAVDNGADSVGLLRTELLFIHRAAAPTTDEHRQSYQAIVEPARLAGMDFESGLTHVLLRDLAPGSATRGTGEVGALPLLSHALLATWEQGRQRTMTIADYAATGGIHGAIAQTADAVYTGLTEAERDVLRRNSWDAAFL